MNSTLYSILVDEETEDNITLRAMSDKGTVLSAIGLWWTLKRHDWFPHRWYGYSSGEFNLDNPEEWGWCWRGHKFRVRTRNG